MSAAAASAPPSDAPVPVECVLAATPEWGIGAGGTLPWSLPSDLARFRSLTLGGAVIMGRRTWASLPARARPLPGRLNVVLSRGEASAVRAAEGLPDAVEVFGSLPAAVAALRARRPAPRAIFVIGGAAAFAEALAAGGAADTLHLTRVAAPAFACDVAVPALDAGEWALAECEPRGAENGVEFQYRTFRRRSAFPALRRSIRPTPPAALHAAGRHEEHQYLDAIRDIIATGVARGDRTGTGTLSKFGLTVRCRRRCEGPARAAAL
jgi:dihydrofolate reductase/thymidylate synthase